MKKKISVNELHIGMYVAELDRPWLESPFLFQGFFLESQRDIMRVKETCAYVVIDTLKGADVAPSQAGTVPVQSKPKRSLVHYEKRVPLDEELEPARDVRRSTRSYVDSIFDDVRFGRIPDLSEAKQLVSDMVDSIVRNPDAQICLTQLKNRDEYTAQHSVNVCVLSITFGRCLGMPKESLNLLGMGALLHDIGKLETPLEVLNKPGRLTDEEFSIMKSHPQNGRSILERNRAMPASVVDIAFSHHERLHGHGYPRGLKVEEISPWSKLVAITDVYDAITSNRCYHDGMTATEALTRMYEWRIRDFDPVMLEQFIHCMGIYPIGSVVELTSGEVGIVVSTYPEQRLRPIVQLVLDEHRKPLLRPRIVDLRSIDRADGDVYAIRRVLEPGEHSINVGEYLSRLSIGS